MAAVSIAAVKRCQANVTFVTDFFSVCLCVSIKTPLSKSVSCKYSYTPLASWQANHLQAPCFPAAWQMGRSSTGPWTCVVLGNMCFCLASHPASVLHCCWCTCECLPCPGNSSSATVIPNTRPGSSPPYHSLWTVPCISAG